MIKTMTLQAVIGLAAKVSARTGEGRVVVKIRPPYVPDVKRGVYETAFGKTKIEGVWLDPFHGIWKVKVRFLDTELQNPVLKGEVTEKLKEKLKK